MAKEPLKKAKKVGTVQFNFKRMIKGLYEIDVISRSAREPVFEIVTIVLSKPQIDILVRTCDVSSCLNLHHPIFLSDSVVLNFKKKLICFGNDYPVPFTCLIGGSEIVAPVGAFDFLSKSDIYADLPCDESDNREPEQGEIPLS